MLKLPNHCDRMAKESHRAWSVRKGSSQRIMKVRQHDTLPGRYAIMVAISIVDPQNTKRSNGAIESGHIEVSR